eukprot:s469_g40.t1
MVAGSIRQTFRVMPWAQEDLSRMGIPQITNSLDDELLAAVTCLDTTQKQTESAEEIRGSLRVAFTHLNRGDVVVQNLQRMAIYATSLYMYAMQMLQAGSGLHFHRSEECGHGDWNRRG